MRGRVLEPDGAPSPGAWVQLSRGESQHSTRTNEHGAFSLERPKGAGRWTVFARNRGRMVEQKLQDLPDELEVTLRAAATVRGTALDRAGPAINAITVNVAFDPTTPGRFGGSLTGDVSFQGAAFEIPDLPGERMIVSVVSDDGRSGKASVHGTGGGDRPIEVILESAPTIRLRVIRGDDRTPVRGARILVDGDWSRPVFTVADGTATLTVIAPGPHRISADGAPPLQPVERKIEAAAGQAIELGDLMLEPPRIAPGTIGAGLVEQDGRLFFEEPLSNSPALAAGVLGGDELLEVGGVAITMGLVDATQRLSGAPGSGVELVVRRAGGVTRMSAVRQPGSPEPSTSP